MLIYVIHDICFRILRCESICIYLYWSVFVSVSVFVFCIGSLIAEVARWRWVVVPVYVQMNIYFYIYLYLCLYLYLYFYFASVMAEGAKYRRVFGPLGGEAAIPIQTNTASSSHHPVHCHITIIYHIWPSYIIYHHHISYITIIYIYHIHHISYTIIISP